MIDFYNNLKKHFSSKSQIQLFKQKNKDKFVFFTKVYKTNTLFLKNF